MKLLRNQSDNDQVLSAQKGPSELMDEERNFYLLSETANDREDILTSRKKSQKKKN